MRPEELWFVIPITILVAIWIGRSAIFFYGCKRDK
jgi:hypothetical protein